MQGLILNGLPPATPFVLTSCLIGGNASGNSTRAGEIFRGAQWDSLSLVPEAGLEPAQGCPYRILSPLCVRLTIGNYKICFSIM